MSADGDATNGFEPPASDGPDRHGANEAPSALEFYSRAHFRREMTHGGRIDYSCAEVHHREHEKLIGEVSAIAAHTTAFGTAATTPARCGIGGVTLSRTTA